MIKISTVVTNIVFSSDFAVEGLRKNCLNLSAYAEFIRPEVEAIAKKPVTKSSVVIALSRIAKELEKTEPVVPVFSLQNLSTAHNLFEVSFGTGPETRAKLMRLHLDPSFEGEHFLNIAMGLSEVAIIASQSDKQYILNEMKPRKPRSLIEDLGAIRVHIDQDTYNTPNVLYSMLKIMANAKINIQSFTAAVRELTFIVKEEDVKPTFLLMHDNFTAKPSAKGQVYSK